MPVTKGAKSRDDAAEELNPTQGTPIEKPSEERIPEKEDPEIKKEGFPQEDTSATKEDIDIPPPEQRECEERDDAAGVVESKLPKEGSSSTRSEVSSTSSKPHQTEGTAGIKQQNLSGDDITSPDITTSSISVDTLSEPGEELEPQINPGSELQCRSCNSRYTPTEEKPDSCSDPCPACKSGTISPLIPQIPQPMGNPVKNPRKDDPLQEGEEPEEEPPSAVVAVDVPGMPREDSPPPEDNPSPEGNSPPEDNSPSEDQPLPRTPPEQLQIDESNINPRNRSIWQRIKLCIKLFLASILALIVFVLVWLFVFFPIIFPDLTSPPSDSRNRLEKTHSARWTPFKESVM